MKEPVEPAAAPEGQEQADTPTATTEATEPLGEGGKAALEAERRARREAERRAKAAEARLEEARLASLSESEKAVEEARRAAREETAAGFRAKLAAAALRAAAAGKLQDPEDAVRFIDIAGIDVTDDGEVDPKGLDTLVDSLVKDRPYLAVNAQAKPGPLPGGGPNVKGGDTPDMNAFIRDMVLARRSI